MKNFLAGSCVIAVALFHLSAPSIAETLDFRFKKPADAKGWKSISQTWAVVDNAYRPVGQADDRAVAILKKPSFADVKATFTLAPSDPLIPDPDGGGFIRGSISSKGRLSGYYVQATYYIDDQTLEFRLRRFDKLNLDKAVKAVTLCEAVVNEADWDRTATIVAKGSRISIEYRGEKLCSVVDDTYANGPVGLFNVYSFERQGYSRVKIVAPDD